MAAPDRIDELRHRYAARPRRYFAPLANALRQAGALEEAVTMLRAQLAEFPDHLTGHVVLGQALFDAGTLVDARSAFENARALDPGNRVVLRYLGDIASLAGDPAEARLWFGRLRAADPYADDVAAQLGGGAAAPPDADDAPAEPVAVDATREVHESERAADTVASEPFELLEFDAVGPPDASEVEAPHPSTTLGGAGDASTALDPVVGLDLAPAAPPSELDGAVGGAVEDDVADVVNPPDEDDATLDHIAAGPFATETMAGLLAAQGHTEQAITLYERLSVERPDDALLRARLDALRGRPEVVAADGAAPPPGRPARPGATDAERGALLAAAFSDVARPQPAAEPAPAPAEVERDAPDAAPFADVSFDRFFAAATTDADADLARFDAWLRDAA